MMILSLHLLSSYRYNTLKRLKIAWRPTLGFYRPPLT